MKKKETRETVEEYLKRGGKVKVLPDEVVWDMFPLKSERLFNPKILDYERDHRPRRAETFKTK